ncbi:ADP-ribosylation, partial [Pholiota conissans]
LCEVCQLRPKHFDGTKTHPFCSKTCANKKANATGNQTTTGPGNGNCNFCHNRPKYSDGTKTHDYCSKACARSASGPQRKMTSGGHPAHAPKMANSHFCSQTCTDDAESKGPMILEVPAGHVTFKSVSDQFKASWRHVGTVCPPVRRVYKILVPPASLAAYNAYKDDVETRGQFASSGRSEGNENRRWHGTRRVCNLGDKGHTQFCAATNCSLCCIIRTSYDISLWGKKTGWGRFGKGIYTSSTSSKSNDYSQNDCKSNLKAILLNKVVVGKGCKLLQDNTSLTAPPAGFDSVLAERGGSLNYDELVVYSNDAIRPSFLVMY